MKNESLFNEIFDNYWNSLIAYEHILMETTTKREKTRGVGVTKTWNTSNARHLLYTKRTSKTNKEYDDKPEA